MSSAPGGMYLWPGGIQHQPPTTWTADAQKIATHRSPICGQMVLIIPHMQLRRNPYHNQCTILSNRRRCPLHPPLWFRPERCHTDDQRTSPYREARPQQRRTPVASAAARRRRQGVGGGIAGDGCPRATCMLPRAFPRRACVP